MYDGRQREEMMRGMRDLAGWLSFWEACSCGGWVCWASWVELWRRDRGGYGRDDVVF